MITPAGWAKVRQQRLFAFELLVVQNPFRMGYEGVRTALAVSKGEQVPANIDTGASLITKANMNSARSQELLNPKIK